MPPIQCSSSLQVLLILLVVLNRSSMVLLLRWLVKRLFHCSTTGGSKLTVNRSISISISIYWVLFHLRLRRLVWGTDVSILLLENSGVGVGMSNQLNDTQDPGTSDERGMGLCLKLCVSLISERLWDVRVNAVIRKQNAADHTWNSIDEVGGCIAEQLLPWPIPSLGNGLPLSFFMMHYQTLYKVVSQWRP